MAIARVRAGVIIGAVLVAGCASDAPAEESSNTTVTTEAPAASSDTTDTSPAPTSATQVSETHMSGPAEYDFTPIGPIVADFVADKGLDGAGLVIVDDVDGVIHQEYWGEFTADRISFVASSSKMITAGVLLRLQEEGLLDIDAPISDVVPWGSANPTITTAQLLSNSSGLVGLFDEGAAPYMCQYLPTGTMQDCAETIFTTPDDDAHVIEPDTQFRYGGAQWQVAGAVAEAAAGRSWAELIDEIYVQPCGLQTLGYNNHFAQLGPGGFAYPDDFDGDPSVLQPTDNPNMEAGVYVTTGDYAELLLMHLREGMCAGETVLSQDSLDLMHADRIAEAYGGDAYSPDTGYGLGWWVDRPSGRITDQGAYGSVPWLDLDDGYGAYLVIEDDSTTGAELADLLYDVIDEAHAAAS